jgi:hypothetical protein
VPFYVILPITIILSVGTSVYPSNEGFIVNIEFDPTVWNDIIADEGM